MSSEDFVPPLAAKLTAAFKKGTVSGRGVHRSASLLLNLEIPMADLLLP
jgi:hypothetical protein